MTAYLAQLWGVLWEPEGGLLALWVVSFVSSTLLPLGSEPVLAGLVHLNPHLLWPAIGVATLGNTLGSVLTWWMGRATHNLLQRLRHERQGWQYNATLYLHRLGPKACLLAWLPVIGDILCAVAGYFRLPFWPCLVYIAIGKFLRYLAVVGMMQSLMQFLEQ